MSLQPGYLEEDVDIVERTFSRLVHLNPEEIGFIQNYMLSTPKVSFLKHMTGKVLMFNAMVYEFRRKFPTCGDPLKLTLDDLTSDDENIPCKASAWIMAQTICFAKQMIIHEKGSERFWGYLQMHKMDLLREFCILHIGMF